MNVYLPPRSVTLPSAGSNPKFFRSAAGVEKPGSPVLRTTVGSQRSAVWALSAGYTTAIDFAAQTSGRPFAATVSVSPIFIVSTFFGHSTVHVHSRGLPLL